LARRARVSTVLGLLAIVFWSTTIGVSRSLVEKVGPMTAAAALLLVGGALGCVWLALREGGLGGTARLPAGYLAGCGALFVAYEVCLYLALGLAEDRPQVLVVGVINYLWPGLTLVLSVPLLKRRAGPLLFPGAAAAFGGVALGVAGAGDLTWKSFLGAIGNSPVPYGFALGAAVAWALYSNLARRWAREAEGEAVPLFLLASGAAAAALRFALHERSQWSPAAGAEVLFLALFTSLLAYVFWDRAVRHGDHALVAASSYATPLLSTGISCVYLAIAPGWHLWVGCGLVVAGAVVCRLSVKPSAAAPG
jgi:drug/metabolite transporter (DMT)-like permease